MNEINDKVYLLTCGLVVHHVGGLEHCDHPEHAPAPAPALQLLHAGVGGQDELAGVPRPPAAQLLAAASAVDNIIYLYYSFETRNDKIWPGGVIDIRSLLCFHPRILLGCHHLLIRI